MARQAFGCRAAAMTVAVCGLLAGCNQMPGGMTGQPPVVTTPSADYDPGTVRQVQRELIRLDFLHDVADGVAGPRTTAAIRRYQQANGMVVDGVPTGYLLSRLQADRSVSRTVTAKPAAPSVKPPPSGTADATTPPPAPSGWVAPAPTAAAPAPTAAATSPAAPPPPPSGWVAPAPTVQ